MIKLYKKYLPKYKLHLIFGPLFKILEAIFELFVPLVIKYMIDNIVNNDSIVDKAIKTQRLWICGAILLGFAICGFITTMIAQYIAAKASQGFGTDIRNDLYKHINSLSFKELDKINSASLITRLQSDTVNVENSVAMIIRLVLRAPFIVIGATIMSFFVNVLAGLIFLGSTIILFLLMYFIMRLMYPYSKKGQQELDNITLISKENLSGNRVIRAFTKEDYERNRFKALEDKVTNLYIKLSSREALLNPLTYVVVNVASIAVIYLSGMQFPNNITQGDIQALINYFVQIQIAVVAVTGLVVLFSKAIASSNKINEVFALQSSLIYGEVNEIDINNKNAIEFKNVSFSYNESKLALNNINFIIHKGETIGVIGGTGSGKSTLVHLINRFYEAKNGEIKIFNNNIKNYSKYALNHNIATVMQKAVIFKGSVKSNLLKAKEDASELELTKALKVAQAFDFVMKMSDGINSQIYQNGKNLSGGQKQRLSIARALVKDAPILILDDSSSALDYQTDKRLREAISTLHKTTIIISQRARSVMKADKIFVFEKGEIVDIGTHEELLKTSSVYKEICASQDELGK